MERHKIALATLFSCLAISTTVLAADKDWTETFLLKDGSLLTHTPEYFSINNRLIVCDNIDIGNNTFLHGVPMPYGLHLKTDSSREAFVEALTQSGLYPA